MKLRVARVVEVTEAEGPGARFALWAQGCSIRCKGCCNPEMADPRGGEELEVSALVERLERVAPRIEGVTILGGEPFEQPAPLACFAGAARALGLSVMTFTGYRLDQLFARRDAATEALVAASDVLKDGPYVHARPERRRRWVGSENQAFFYFTPRYTAAIEVPGPEAPAQTVEARLGPDGTLHVNGWPERFAALRGVDVRAGR
jgi:anaerobic ribonucleoside-triphosphate reductase activating protein